MLLNFFQARDAHRHSKHRRDREFIRSMSMFPHENYDQIVQPHRAQFSRLLSANLNSHENQDEFLARQLLTREDLMHTFEQLHMRSDNDDADDEDDDDGRTPTAVARSPPKFPHN